MENRKRKWNGGITLPILNSLLHHTLEDDVYVDGESFALLLEIQRKLAVFEPTGDDEARMIWLEIPRGTAEEWKAFDDEHNWHSTVGWTTRFQRTAHPCPPCPPQGQ